MRSRKFLIKDRYVTDLINNFLPDLKRLESISLCHSSCTVQNSPTGIKSNQKKEIFDHTAEISAAFEAIGSLSNSSRWRVSTTAGDKLVRAFKDWVRDVQQVFLANSRAGSLISSCRRQVKICSNIRLTSWCSFEVAYLTYYRHRRSPVRTDCWDPVHSAALRWFPARTSA